MTRGVEAAALACVREGTPRAVEVLGYVLERWNGLTDTQRARVYTLADQLHRTTALRRAGQAMHGCAP